MPTVPWQTRSAVEPGTEYLVMASHLPLSSIVNVPCFLSLTVSVVRQLERTDGLVGYSLRAQPVAGTFWTLSAWADAEAFGAFVRERPHRDVIAKLRPHMGSTRFTTWTAPGSALPVPWDLAIERLQGSSARNRATHNDPARHRPTDHEHPRPDKEHPS
jgi:hypothetical protein